MHMYELRDAVGRVVDALETEVRQDADEWAYEKGRQRGLREWELNFDGAVIAWPNNVSGEDGYIIAATDD